MYYRPIFTSIDKEATPRTVNVVQRGTYPEYELHQWRFYAQACKQRISRNERLLYRIIVTPKRG